MSFFNNVEVSKEFDMGGGDFDPIPNNTQLKAMIEEAKWDAYEGDEYISLRWSILGGEFNNRKVFQKIRAKDEDSKKSEKALRMLAAIDANAGGKLVASGVEPDDFALTSSLANKAMMITLAVWEINDKKGNWIKSVAAGGAATQAQPVAQAQAKPAADSIEGDIPF